MTIEDQDYLRRAESCMQGLLDQLDRLDPDELEADLSQGVLKISFADGRVCIINRQGAAHQIWLAEGATAWHFEHDASANAWMDTKGRGDLMAILSKIVADRLGRPITLCSKA